MRLAAAIFALGVVVAAATIGVAVLRSDLGQPGRSDRGRAVQAGAPSPMLQDIDPERLDVSRAAPTASPRSTPPPVRRVGDAVLYNDGWKVTLLSIGERPQPTPGIFTKPNPEIRLVVVTLRFENGGTIGASANLFNFKLQHGDAVRDGPSPCFADCPPDQLFTSFELGPGGSQVRWLRFSAAVGDTKLSLVYERIGYREVVWNLY
jgi:hypothetical protein